MATSVLVLYSGGMDSTVLLYYIRQVLLCHKVEAIIFDYGQRHRIEISYAQEMVKKLVIPYKIVKVDLTQFGESSLTSDDKDLPVVVPGRNSIFLSLAAAYAKTRGLEDIFFGPNLEDYKGFPDCRENYVESMSKALVLGTGIRTIRVPFINMSKREIVTLGKELGVPFGDTWSCYFPVKTDEIFAVIDNRLQYKPCGKCHACIERSKVL